MHILPLKGYIVRNLTRYSQCIFLFDQSLICASLLALSPFSWMLSLNLLGFSPSWQVTTLCEHPLRPPWTHYVLVPGVPSAGYSPCLALAPLECIRMPLPRTTLAPSGSSSCPFWAPTPCTRLPRCKDTSSPNLGSNCPAAGVLSGCPPHLIWAPSTSFSVIPPPPLPSSPCSGSDTSLQVALFILHRVWRQATTCCGHPPCSSWTLASHSELPALQRCPPGFVYTYTSPFSLTVSQIILFSGV